MPTYPYKCINCGWEGEVVQKITDEPLEFIRHTLRGESAINKTIGKGKVQCSGQMKRLIGKTSFRLSGGGWASSGYSG